MLELKNSTFDPGRVYFGSLYPGQECILVHFTLDSSSLSKLGVLLLLGRVITVRIIQPVDLWTLRNQGAQIAWLLISYSVKAPLGQEQTARENSDPIKYRLTGSSDPLCMRSFPASSIAFFGLGFSTAFLFSLGKRPDLDRFGKKKGKPIYCRGQGSV